MYYLINFILIVSLYSAEAGVKIYLTDGPIKQIGTRLYKEELLTDKFSDPKELAYDSSSRNLFFMYMDDDIQNSGRAFVNIITKQTKKIKGIERNKATAVDPDTGDVYFGTENGLYKYDAIENIAMQMGLYNVNILKLVIRNKEMYLLDANNHMLYKVFEEGTRVVRIGDMKTVMEFGVDNQRNIHYVSMCGLFCVAGGHEIVKNKDLSVVYHFISDEDTTFGITADGIYDIDCKNGTAQRVSDLEFLPRSIILGDYGDIFYSVDNNIYRLRPIKSYLLYNTYKNQQNKTNDVS